MPAHLRAAIFFAAASMGDALLYLVLPAAGAAFGLSPFWVGAALSVNRLARIAGGNRLAAEIVGRIGSRRSFAAALAMAGATTMIYGLAPGVVLFIAARVLWGLSYAVLRLGLYDYALRGTGVSSRLGWAMALGALGPALVTGLGGSLASAVSPVMLFAGLGLISLICVPPAMSLPMLNADSLSASQSQSQSRAQSQSQAQAKSTSGFRGPGGVSLLIFVFALATDGVLIMELPELLRESGYDGAGALHIAGLVLAGRRLSIILLGPVAGGLGRRFGVRPMFLLFAAAMLAGLALTAAGFSLWGIGVMITARAHTQILAPGLIALEPGGNVYARLARLGTWRDLGAALGPVLPSMVPGDLNLFAGLFCAGALAFTAMLWTRLRA